MPSSAQLIAHLGSTRKPPLFPQVALAASTLSLLGRNMSINSVIQSLLLQAETGDLRHFVPATNCSGFLSDFFSLRIFTWSDQQMSFYVLFLSDESFFCFITRVILAREKACADIWGIISLLIII